MRVCTNVHDNILYLEIRGSKALSQVTLLQHAQYGYGEGNLYVD